MDCLVFRRNLRERRPGKWCHAALDHLRCCKECRRWARRAELGGLTTALPAGTAPLPGGLVTEHRLCDCGLDSCQACRGGLALCLTCGGAEASLPTECPGKRMTAGEEDAVREGLRDYRGGEWTLVVQYVNSGHGTVCGAGWDGVGWYWWGGAGCHGPYPSRGAAWRAHDQHAVATKEE